MSSVGWEALIVVVLVLGNGFFAMAEIAIVSARRARLQELSAGGSRGARIALRLAEKPTEFLATVQIGISAVGVISGAYAGVTIGERLSEFFLTIPLLAPRAELLGVGLVVVTITYLSLVVGELAPKRLALAHREAIAARVAPFMYALSRMAAPVAWFLTVSTNAVLRLLHVRPSAEAPISDEELRLLISEGTRAGVFEELEQDIIERLLQLDDRRIESVMRPRRRVTWLNRGDDEKAAIAKIAQSPFSRLPVYDSERQAVIGVLEGRRLLATHALGQPVTVEQAMEPPLFIPENASLLDGLEALREQGKKMAMVVDEYGSLQGIVTRGDILQALIGGKQDHHADEPAVAPRSEGGYLVDGGLAVQDFREYFGLPLSEAPTHYHTVAGLAMDELGDIPSEGDSFEWEGLRFEILDMDGYRVDKLLVFGEPTPPPADD
ncbi:MAG: hemolysin family protein [Armatimonadota bacterium]